MIFCALTGLAGPTLITAQILVTDVNPDEVYGNSGDTCFVDLNNDSVDDLAIAYWRAATGECGGECPEVIVSGHPSSVTAIPLQESAFALDQWGRIKAMDSLEIIDQSTTWGAVGQMVMARVTTGCVGWQGCIPTDRSGAWSGGNNISSPDRFLGVRLIVESDTLFGWVRGVVPYSSDLPSFILRAYAVNPVPSEAAFAGSTTTLATGELAREPSLLLWPNPSTSHFFIQMPEGMMRWTGRIFKLTGEHVMFISDQGHTTTPRVEISHLEAGVYLFEVFSEKGRMLQKVVKY